MSICSDVYIDIETARQKVKAKLMYEQERLIDSAVKGMEDWELSSYLNQDSSLYYYNITSKKKTKDKK